MSGAGEQQPNVCGNRKREPFRDLTDESLKVERDKADARAEEKLDAVERDADEVVREARDRADQVVESARKKADAPAGSQVSADEAQERSRADDALHRERATADAVLEDERQARRRYLAEFVATERETTDKDLVAERAYADSMTAARDEFLATASHDIRSLLAGLSVNAAVMVRRAPVGEAGQQLREFGETTASLVARMNRLVSDLLDVVSIEAGALAILPEEVDVGQILRDSVEAFAPVAAAKGVSLTADQSSPLLRAALDGDRILQVLANLVSNALKFTSSGGLVTISVQMSADSIRFAVSDTGVGIPESRLSEIFERFRQVSKDRRGLGLGLHISKSIVEAHGGRMWVESAPSVGTSFFFELPATLPG